MFSFFCNISEHVGKHSGVGVGCFASDGSGKICGVLCGVQAGGKFFCFGTQLANSGRQASSSGSRFSGLRLCIFHSLITGNNAALFNNTGGGLGVDFLTDSFTVSAWIDRYEVLLQRRSLSVNTYKIRSNQLATVREKMGK